MCDMMASVCVFNGCSVLQLGSHYHSHTLGPYQQTCEAYALPAHNMHAWYTAHAFESVLLCYAVLCYAMLCYAMLCYAMLCYAMLCYAMLCYAMLCYAMLCYAMLCYAMLCYAMLCCAMLCCAVLIAGYLSVLLGVLFMAAAAIVLFVFRYQIGPLFVDDARVRQEVAGVAPICAAYQIPDGIYGVSSGVLR